MERFLEIDLQLTLLFVNVIVGLKLELARCSREQRPQSGDGCVALLTVCVSSNPLIKPVQSGLTGLLTGLVH